MNPTQTTQNPNVVSSENLLEKAFENNEFAQTVVPPIDEEDLVTHSEDHKAEIRNSWAEFYAMRSQVTENPAAQTEVKQTVVETVKTTETVEGPVSKVEVSQMVVEQIFKPHAVETPKTNPDSGRFDIIKEQKGSTSAWKESGIKVLPDYKDIGKSLWGALNIFKEIFTDTAKLLYKSFTEKFLTPEEIKKNDEKKAKQKEKNARIQDFYNKMAAQKAAIVTVEADRFQTQEKENVNKTLKLTNTAYKGIKDSAGRLTVYAASMFEREQLEGERQMKKVEKQQKMAAVKGPDLNLDKAAEGGFLSSTGGQGAG